MSKAGKSTIRPGERFITLEQAFTGVPSEEAGSTLTFQLGVQEHTVDVSQGWGGLYNRIIERSDGARARLGGCEGIGIAAAGKEVLNGKLLLRFSGVFLTLDPDVMNESVYEDTLPIILKKDAKRTTYEGAFNDFRGGAWLGATDNMQIAERRVLHAADGGKAYFVAFRGMPTDNVLEVLHKSLRS